MVRPLALLLTLFIAAVCGHGRATAPQPTAAQARATALHAAIEIYHQDDDLGPLRAWVKAHPEAPEATVWREVIALQDYKRVVARRADRISPEKDWWKIDPGQVSEAPDVPAMIGIAQQHTGTVAGRTAQAFLEADGLRRLVDPPLNRRVVDFLSGGERWAYDDSGRSLLPDVDLTAFRQRHEDRLRQRFGQRLLEDACETAMGYCTWWVSRYPDSHPTAELQASMKRIWYRRAHPRWRNARYANCAFQCAKRCRRSAEPLDDSCYPPCFDRCG